MQELAVDNTTLSFSVLAIAAQLKGEWIGDRWQGHLRQQLETPLSLQRGLPV